MSHALLLSALLVALCACASLAGALVNCRRGRNEMAGQLKALMTAEKSAMRQLRLGSHSLRAIGMTLEGHAKRMQAGDPPDIVGIAAAANGVFDIAGTMHEWAQNALQAQALSEEAVQIGNALDGAISTVTLSMLPGRRNWHVEPEMLELTLRADRRALRHVFTRALSIAVRSSGHDDTIRVHIERMDGVTAVVIETQPRAEVPISLPANSGVPDLRLTLARALMEAHGGKLEAEHGDGIGLCLRIAFPNSRFIRDTSEVPEPPAELAAFAIDDRMRRALVT